MERKNYFHFFANGDDAKNFIISKEDFVYEFNLIGICSFVSGVTVLAFNIEDSHPHALLYGTLEQALNFKNRFETSSLKHISVTRGSHDNVRLDCELIAIKDEEHLMKVAAYVIIQPTKDGKPVMYYDYRWGTGSMYFRPMSHGAIWERDDGGRPVKLARYADLTVKERKAVSSRTILPDDWIIAGGIILPSNYVDVKGYESIFKTHNCFRSFTGASRKQLTDVMEHMASSRGVLMEDLEAREKCKQLSKVLFKTYDIKTLDLQKRLRLATELRMSYSLSYRQLATVVRLPENEVRKYLQ